MKIISIDASTKSTGVACFEGQNLIAYDCFTASSTSLVKRIKKITENLKSFITLNTPDKIVLEEVRPDPIAGTTKNLKTYRALMYLQASIMFMLDESFPKVEVEFVYPSSWRSQCGIKIGRGIKRTTLKEADIEFVKQTYGFTTNDDIADAICIGHAFIYSIESKNDNEINWQ